MNNYIGWNKNMIIKCKGVEWEYQNKVNLWLSFNNWIKKSNQYNKDYHKKNNTVKCYKNYIHRLDQCHNYKLLQQ